MTEGETSFWAIKAVLLDTAIGCYLRAWAGHPSLSNSVVATCTSHHWAA